MTETPSNREGSGPPGESIQDAEPRQPTHHWSGHPARDLGRQGSEPGEAPERDPERRSKPAPEDPIDRPGPLNPGEEDRDLPTGVESYERPGRDGNWEPRND